MLTLGSINLATAWSCRLATRPACGLENQARIIPHVPRLGQPRRSRRRFIRHLFPRNTKPSRFHRDSPSVPAGKQGSEPWRLPAAVIRPKL